MSLLMFVHVVLIGTIWSLLLAKLVAGGRSYGSEARPVSSSNNSTYSAMRTQEDQTYAGPEKEDVVVNVDDDDDDDDAWNKNVVPILKEAVNKGVFTAAAAYAARPTELWKVAYVGTLGGEHDPRPTTNETMFDLASLTKVLATTTTVAYMVDRGWMDVDEMVASYMPTEFASRGKQNIKVRHCLAHAAGYPPDPQPNYWQPEFACPNGGLGPGDYPVTSTMDCADRALDQLTKQELVYTPGDYRSTKYSDLSFITLAFAAGVVLRNHASDVRDMASYLSPSEKELDGCEPLESPDGSGKSLLCAYEFFYRAVVLPSGNVPELPTPSYPRYLPLLGSMYAPGGPCALTAIPEGEVSLFKAPPPPLQCRVEDGNAEQLGGISGHAGLFGSLPQVIALMNNFWIVDGNQVLTDETRKIFTSMVAPGQSTRALGWDTNHRGSYDDGFDGVCGDVLPANAFLHIGYTGTMVCASEGALLILLTNRVFPVDDDASRARIKAVRKQFADEAARVVTRVRYSGPTL